MISFGLPDDIRERMRVAGSGDAAQAEGVRIAQEALVAVRELVQGAYIMPPFNRVDTAIAVLEAVTDRWRPARAAAQGAA